MTGRLARWAGGLAALLLAGAVHAAPVAAVGQSLALPALAQAAHLPREALDGKVVVLAWFATWCPFCMHEAPQLQRLYAANSQRLVVIGVNDEPRGSEQAARVKQWVARFGWTFPVVTDTAALNGLLPKPKGLPVLVVLDRSGVIRQVESGEMLDEDIDDIGAFARREEP